MNAMLARVTGISLALLTQAGWMVGWGDATSWGAARGHVQPVRDADEPTIIIPQGRTIIVPPPRPRTGPWQPVKLTNASLNVSLTDQLATTVLEMTVFNPGNTPQEAQLLVPVPEGAAVRSFHVEGLTPETGAKILPRDEARRIYESIVSRMRDPGLVEFAGYSQIRTSVFPVPAGGKQTVRLTYEQTAATDGDRIDYVFPRTEALDRTGVDWTIGAEITSTRPISTVYSPSHGVIVERRGEDRAVVKVSRSEATESGTFRLSYLLQPRKGDGLSASILAYPDPESAGGRGGYFMLLAALPASKDGSREAVKREVILVIDRSGSMNGEKIRQARDAALQVLEGLREGERFNIIDYSDSVATFAPDPVAKTDESMRKAREYIKGLRAEGGTNIKDALLEALKAKPREGDLPLILFLTDGLPTVGETREVAIREAVLSGNTAGRRLFTFGVGFDVNAPLLSGLARATRATSTFVLPDEDVEVKVGQVFKRLEGPLFTTPRLTAVNARTGEVLTRGVRDLMPGELPDIFDGDQLVVLGRYTGEDLDSGRLRLRLEGSYLGNPRTFDVDFDAAEASSHHSFVPRLWATRKIGALIEQIRQNSAGGSSDPNDPRFKELVDEIVRLSTTYGILTEYTAFLAVEPGAVDHAGRPMPAAPMADARREIRGRLSERAKDRAGAGGVNQSINLGQMEAQSAAPARQAYVGADMKKVDVRGVQQVADRSLLYRGGRWVDTRLVDREAEAPDRTVEFGTADYFTLVDQLAKEGRQGMLAQRGDVYLLVQGQRILVKCPQD